MGDIGGNITGIIQTKTTSGKNAIGEAIDSWVEVCRPNGWLDLQNGDSKYNNFSAKVEESTHIFLCDFKSDIYALTIPDKNGKTPVVRMILKGVVYDVLLIDNPMEMNEQLEIYLRKVGAWDGK